MIDFATRQGIATRIDERLRSSYLLENHSITVPLTHGHDELLPFWKIGDARPSDAEALKRSRGRPDAAADAPFVPRDILGGPEVLGCGYMEFVIKSGGIPSTAQPGVIGRQTNEPIDLQAWFYTPATRSTEIDEIYTGAFRAIWESTHVPRSYFESHFPPGQGVLFIDQLQPIQIPDTRGPVGTYKRTGIKIPLLRRTSVVRSNSP